MIRYTSLIDYKEWGPIRDVWNQEMGFIYPITERLFQQNTINCPYLYPEGSFVALDCEQSVVGFILTKCWNQDVRVAKYQSVGFISLFYVKETFRKQGIGSKLFELAEEQFVQLGKTEIWIGKDVHNFFPGVPVDLEVITVPWLVKRGYDCEKHTHDLISYDITKSDTTLKNQGRFLFRQANQADYPAMLQFFEKNFPGRWLYEFDVYFKEGYSGSDFIVCFDQEKVIAFIRVSTENSPTLPYPISWYGRFHALGGLGPLGVDRDYRKVHLGSDIIKAGLSQLKNLGIKETIIDWTSLLEFYRKFGFEVWKTYRYCSKALQ